MGVGGHLFCVFCSQQFSYLTRFGEALEQVAQRGGGCPILEHIQGQAAPDCGQPDLAVGVPCSFQGSWTR